MRNNVIIVAGTKHLLSRKMPLSTCVWLKTHLIRSNRRITRSIKPRYGQGEMQLHRLHHSTEQGCGKWSRLSDNTCTAISSISRVSDLHKTSRYYACQRQRCSRARRLVAKLACEYRDEQQDFTNLSWTSFTLGNFCPKTNRSQVVSNCSPIESEWFSRAVR